MRRDLTGLRLEVSSIAILENLKIIPMSISFGMSLALKNANHIFVQY